MSDRKPTDFPIARGVSPPPRPFRRVPAPAPLTLSPIPPITIATPQFAFAPRSDQVVVRPPAKRKHWPIITVQVGAIILLSGFCMAAGWWIVHRGDHAAPIVVKAAAEPIKPEPIKPAVVVKPIADPPAPSKPIENPTPPPRPKLVVEPIVPTPPQAPAPAPPAKPVEKATTTLTFQKDILPILQSKCVQCHGDRNKLKGGLDVRTLRTLEKGGENGPAINRQNPETSPIWDSVANGQMPPGKNKLSESEKRKLHDWLVGGGK